MTDSLAEARARLETALEVADAIGLNSAGIPNKADLRLVLSALDRRQPTDEDVERMAKKLHNRVYPEEPWEDCPGMWEDHRKTVREILADYRRTDRLISALSQQEEKG